MRTILIALLLAGTVSAACTSPGKERWAIKTSVAPGAKLNAPKQTTLAEIEGLKNPPDAKNKDPKYDAARIPAYGEKISEGDIVTIKGYFYLVATEDNDCEYHMQIAGIPPPDMPENCVIVEVARPDAFENKELSEASAAIRSTVSTKLLKGGEPSSTGNVMQNPVYVQVTGQLFFDNAHLETDGTAEKRGKHKVMSKTLWEIHPVTDLKILTAPAK